MFQKAFSYVEEKNTHFFVLRQKIFHCYPASKTGTDRFITKKNPKEVPNAIRSFQSSKHPAQVMVFRLIASSEEKMPPVFLKTGLRMGAKEYLDQILKPRVFPWIVANSDPQEVPFVQNGTPCHTVCADLAV